MRGQKHLIKCRCILQQLKRAKDPPAHQFVVFSVIDDEDRVMAKYAQCPNCGIIHRVTDIGKSEIMSGKENMSSIVTLDELKLSMSDKLVAMLDSNHADLATFEMAKFIVDNQKWGDVVVLNSELDGKTRQGKYVRILGRELFNVDTFSRTEFV